LRQLYFVTGSAGSQQLVIADLQSHSVQTRSIAIPSSYTFFEWDPVTRRILAVTSGTGSPVVSIDPQSGAIETLFATEVASFGLSAIDPASRQLYYITGIAGSQQLVIADLTSHAVITRSVSIPGSYLLLESTVLPVSSIPTLSVTLLIAVAISLAVVGGFALRNAI